MKNITVLGAGMVGRAIIVDLASNYNVTAADINPKSIELIPKEFGVKGLVKDLGKKENIRNLVKDADLVVNAVPGFMGFETLKTIIECKKNVIDIAFFPEDPFELNKLAIENNVTAIVDCGVAPGMCNVILGYFSGKMKVESYECFVGGLPFTRGWPYQYKAPFSPIDVIEEYTRPARIMRNGKIITKDALTEPEFIEVENIGTLEAFNTDGLRSLLYTMDVPNMLEKTMRYPGHREIMHILRETGFLNEEPIDINGTMIKPIDMTTKLLFPKWLLGQEEREFTVMQVNVVGEENGKLKKYSYKLFDIFHEKTKTSSMARTTGYACTAAVELFMNNDFSRKGICPPEFIGMEDGCLDKMLAYQKDRDIIYELHELTD